MSESEHKFKLFKTANIILVIATVLLILAIGAFLADNWITPKLNYSLELNGGWYKENKHGTYSEVAGRFSIGQTDPVTFYRKLPQNITDEEIIMFKCQYTNVDAYVDGEKIYHAGPATLGHIETTIGNVFVLVPLKSSYSGKIISFTVEPRHNNNEVLIKDAAITTMADYSLSRVFTVTPYFILCFLMIMISVISITLFVVFRLTKKKEYKKDAKGFLLVGLFGICIVLWVISDFHLWGMISGNMAMSGMINYVSFMLCPFLFTGVLRSVFGKRRLIKLILLVTELNFLVQITLFLTGIMDLPTGLIVSQALTVSIVFAMLYFGITSVKRMAQKHLTVLAVPTVCFMVCVIIAIIVYFFNGEWMFVVALAMTFYSIAVISYMLNNLWSALKSNLELEHVKKLAYFDNMTGLENRRAFKEYVDELNAKIKNGQAEKDLTIIMLDVNGLKKTNDIYGHLAGDELLNGSAECIAKVYSSLGRCFRTGGDEFVVIGNIPNKVYDIKSVEFEEILKKFKGEYIDGITISAGKANIADFPDMNADQLMVIADKEMYENKQHYYTTQLMLEHPVIENDSKSARKLRYADNFDLTKYTMPIIRQMAEVIPGGFFIYREDETRELIYNNRKVLDIYGCADLDEFKMLTGYTFEHMVHPDDFHKIQNSIDDQIDSEDGDGVDHVIYRIKRLDGEVRWIDDYGHYSHSPDYGDIYYVFINDITDLMNKRIESGEYKVE